MTEPHGRAPAGRASSRRAALLAVLLIAAGWIVWATQGVRRPTRPRPEDETPYPSARPGVAYVGDAACARCHAAIAERYRAHPMGRSLAAIDDAPEALRGAPEGGTLFEDRGFAYAAQRRDGRTIHGETRRDARGQVLGRVEAPVAWALGSGTRAVAFLVERDGSLFQSPITWYAQTRRWGLSPGYGDDHAAGGRFERPVQPSCLFCHANRVAPVPGTIARYEPPTFRGLAIGCERCHGPGALHAEDPFARPGGAPNIINPADLRPSLREAVCQQCHLLGEAVALKPGRAFADYRPGLPLWRFWTTFVQSPRPSLANAGHVEQMHASRCYLASGEALGCTACHDPHGVPAPAERVGFYRDRCLTCHAEHGCNLPAETRLARQPDDSCTACHMPRAPTSDVPHVATTLHTIPRDGAAALAEAQERSAGDDPDAATPSRLVPFHRDQMAPEDLREARRDLAVALGQPGTPFGPELLPLLRDALSEDPDDRAAREAEGHALRSDGRLDEAAAAFAAVLRAQPGRENALVAAAGVAGERGRPAEAVAYWRRAIAVDPYRSIYHAGLAHELTRLGRWDEADAAARRALELNPASHLARLTLILRAFHAGQPARARAEYETLLQFDPPDPAGLDAWFRALQPE
jgi:hypothetical protein